MIKNATLTFLLSMLLVFIGAGVGSIIERDKYKQRRDESAQVQVKGHLYVLIKTKEGAMCAAHSGNCPCSHPDSTYYHLYKSCILEDAGCIDQAAAAAQNAVVCDPDNMTAKNQYLYIKSVQKNEKERGLYNHK